MQKRNQRNISQSRGRTINREMKNNLGDRENYIGVVTTDRCGIFSSEHELYKQVQDNEIVSKKSFTRIMKARNFIMNEISVIMPAGSIIINPPFEEIDKLSYYKNKPYIRFK